MLNFNLRKTGLLNRLLYFVLHAKMICSLFTTIAVADEPVVDNAFFEREIRPILSTHCISCHNPAKHKGGLDLTSLAAATKGGDTGPAIDTTNPGESLLLDVIHYNADVKMPPKGKLNEKELKALNRWALAKSPWPANSKLLADTNENETSTTAHTGPKLRSKPFNLNESDKTWWSFQPIKRKSAVVNETPPKPLVNAIDSLVLEKLNAKQLNFNREATRRELVRRAYYDLIGLPPTPETVAAFEADQSPNAWEKLVDDLLARPQYGERWARHWLDLVRFAETNGYERDGEKPNAWRYRDYVIQSFNKDKPYDQFLTEQLAGDEMPGEFDPERIIATGYYRLHVWDDEPDSTVAAEFDDLDDMMVTTGASMLGLTLGCARCHDHKFDPISQNDYYSFLAYFRSINPYGLHKTGGGGRGTGRITRPLAGDDELQAWEMKKADELKRLKVALANEKTEEKKKQLQEEIQRFETDAAAPFGLALAIAEDPIKPTFILRRGEASSPTIEVQPDVPELFASSKPVIEPPKHQKTSGRRLAMARWIASDENPLTARVLVNRLWQHHFGRGLVPTPNDFGRTGEAPTHLELLDTLAADFISGGWKIKRLQKQIMMSRAYRMSSRADQANAIKIDEPNQLFWRQNPRRIEAEALRDSILAFSGSLNLKQGGPSVFPALPEDVYKSQDSARRGWPESPLEDQNRRSIYIYVKRALVPPILELFDCPSTTVPAGARAVTTVAPQALLMMNDGFVKGQAKTLANRLMKDAGNDLDAQINRGFAIVLQRPPSTAEFQFARRFFRERNQNGDSPDKILPEFCQALMNLNEVIYVD